MREKCSSTSATDFFQTFASICGFALPLFRISFHHTRVRHCCVWVPGALRGSPGQGVRLIVARGEQHFAQVRYTPLRSARDSLVPVHSSRIGWIATGSCPFLLWTSSLLFLFKAFLVERDNPVSRAAPRPPFVGVLQGSPMFRPRELGQYASGQLHCTSGLTGHEGQAITQRAGRMLLVCGSGGCFERS